MKPQQSARFQSQIIKENIYNKYRKKAFLQLNEELVQTHTYIIHV